MGDQGGSHLSVQRKFPILKNNIYTAQALATGNLTMLGGAAPFPFGQLYYKLLLTFYWTVVIGTGTGAIADGELLAIKDIMIKSDKHGLIYKASGRMLYYLAQLRMKTAPIRNAVAASTGTYKVQIPIFFAMPNARVRRKEDLALNMDTAKSFEVHITLGGLADMFTSVGTATLACTVDVDLERSMYPCDAGNAPIMQPYVYQIPPVDATVMQNFEFEKTPGLGILGFMLGMTSGSTAGVPFSGTLVDNLMKTVTQEDNFLMNFRRTPIWNIKQDMKEVFEQETIPTGLLYLNFIPDGSLWSALPAGGKSYLNLNWVNDQAAAGWQVTPLIDGYKPVGG